MSETLLADASNIGDNVDIKDRPKGNEVLDLIVKSGGCCNVEFLESGACCNTCPLEKTYNLVPIDEICKHNGNTRVSCYRGLSNAEKQRVEKAQELIKKINNIGSK